MEIIDYKKGIRFECQGSSKCCVSRGMYGYVYLTKKDILKISISMDLKVIDFIKLYCDKTDGFTHFKEKMKNDDCQFLVNKRCSIYKARPTQCRSWPFWGENMQPKTWNKVISRFCPGIGKGKIINKEEIEKKIKADKKNEIQMLKEIN